jgi:hypothetical protein
MGIGQPGSGACVPGSEIRQRLGEDLAGAGEVAAEEAADGDLP